MHRPTLNSILKWKCHRTSKCVLEWNALVWNNNEKKPYQSVAKTLLGNTMQCPNLTRGAFPKRKRNCNRAEELPSCRYKNKEFVIGRDYTDTWLLRLQWSQITHTQYVNADLKLRWRGNVVSRTPGMATPTRNIMLMNLEEHLNCLGESPFLIKRKKNGTNVHWASTSRCGASYCM